MSAGLSHGAGRTRGGDDWIERVRAASDIVEVIGASVALRRVGRNWMGLCPFHGEKTPSFSVNAERQFYHCFSCKAGGDVFRFIQEHEKVGFLEAAELLSNRAGIPVPERRGEARGRRAPVLEALDAAATAFEQWLADASTGAAARAYLERRGITHETRRAFRLGLALPGWDHLVPRLRGRFGDEVLLEARLAGRKDGSRSIYDWFRNRLMVPLIAPGGAVVGFGARALGDETPKYLNSSESAVYHKGQFLYAFEQAKRHLTAEGEAVVVEGYFDAIALHQAGVPQAVATSGTALTPEQARLLRRAARGVALTYDGDAAGQEAMLRSLGVLLAEGLDVVVVELAPGDDPDTLVRREGAAGWQARRQGAYDAVEFVQRHVLRTSRGGDPRERALHAIVRIATGVTDPIRWRLLVERASQVFGIPESVLARAVRLQRGGDRSPEPVAAVVRAQRTRHAELERRLLQGLLLWPEGLAIARAAAGPADFHDPACAALAAAMWEQAEHTLDATGEPAALARELQAGAPSGVDWAAEVMGASRNLRLRALRDRRRGLESSLRSASEAEQSRLMNEIHAIAREIQSLSRTIGG